ncbi:tyrosine-type recombinase/integrase [Saccharopolyspora tripterygii]
MSKTTYKAQIYSIRRRKNAKGKVTSYQVRWDTVRPNGERAEHTESFKNSTQADSFRSQLVSAARQGEAFDFETGLPVRMLMKDSPNPPWLKFAQDFIDMKWTELAPKSRKSLIDSMVSVSAAMLTDEWEEGPKSLYRVLRRSLNPTTREADAPAASESWLTAHSRKVSELADPEILRALLAGLERRQDGERAAQDTIRLRRTALRDAIGYLLEKELLDENPMDEVRVKRASVKLKQVDRRSVVNPVQARTLILAVDEIAPRLTAFFALMYFAALRPEEATNLRKRNLSLPESGWGEIVLEKASPEVSGVYTDSGSAGEERSLKHREDQVGRSVPCTPELTEHLHRHLERYGVGPDGLLFWGRRNRGRLSSTVYGRTWAKARTEAFEPSVLRSPLARRPYDLRHAAVSTWLNAGVEPTRVAEWAGHSVGVLLRVYAKCLDGGEQAARQRLGAALGHNT